MSALDEDLEADDDDEEEEEEEEEENVKIYIHTSRTCTYIHRLLVCHMIPV